MPYVTYSDMLQNSQNTQNYESHPIHKTVRVSDSKKQLKYTTTFL